MLGYNSAFGHPVGMPVPTVRAGHYEFDDFFAPPASSTTQGNAKFYKRGTAGTGDGTLVADERGGVAKIVSGATGGNYSHYMYSAVSLKVATDRLIQFVARVRAGSIDADTDIAVGIHDDDVADIVGAATPDGILFRTSGGTTAGLHAVVGDGTNVIDSGALSGIDLTTSDWIELSFEVRRNDSVFFGVNGKEVYSYKFASTTGSGAPAAPSSFLGAFAQVKTGATASKTLFLDSIGFADFVRI